MRVVLTGCAVRERDRRGLARKYPAVDLFLRPDEEPELVDRLGLASMQGAIGAGASPTTAATTIVHQVPVSDASHLAGSRAAASPRASSRMSSNGRLRSGPRENGTMQYVQVLSQP